MTQKQLTILQEFEMAAEEALRDTETRDILIGMKRGIEFCRKRLAKKMLLKLKLDIDTVQSTPGKAWLSKRVQFPSGQGVANQPVLSVAA